MAYQEIRAKCRYRRGMPDQSSSRVSGPTQLDYAAAEKASTQHTRSRWSPKPRAAHLVNAVLHGGPIVGAAVIGLVVARVLPRPFGFMWIAWLAAVVGASQIAMRIIERAVRRLLPLSYLLKFSLSFPDLAPSRFAMALRSGNTQKLNKLAMTAAQDGLPTDLDEAAQTALSMIGTLNRHDKGTRGHSERVRAFSEMLAEELDLDESTREQLRWGALLHDMGKLMVPSEILNKPGRPTEDEWKILAAHPAEGERILAPLADWLGDSYHAAGQHHERWDGKGYPRGLKAEEISLCARIVAVADAFAVMTAARSYKKPLPMAVAREELTKNAGTQFDPEVVRAMLSVSISRINKAAGPIAALANVPLIGSLLSAVPSVSASVAPTAAAAALTAAAIVNPSLSSPLEWTQPETATTIPSQLAFDPGDPGDPAPYPQGAPSKPAQLAPPQGVTAEPATPQDTTVPPSTEFVFGSVTTTSPPPGPGTTVIGPTSAPPSGPASGPTSSARPNSTLVTSEEPAMTSVGARTTLAIPPGVTAPSTRAITTVQQTTTLADSVPPNTGTKPGKLPNADPPLTSPPTTDSKPTTVVDTTPPIIIGLPTTTDAPTTKVPRPQPFATTTTMPATTTTDPTTKQPTTIAVTTVAPTATTDPTTKS